MKQYLAHISDDRRKQSVKEHLEETAELAASFAKDFGAEELARLTGLLHDVGKYSNAFQKRIHDPENTAKVDHSTAGAQEAFRLRNAPAAYAVAGHHAGLPDGGSKVDTAGDSTLMGRMKRKVEPYGQWKQEISLPSATFPPYIMKDEFTRSFFTRMLYSCLVDADFLNTERFMLGHPENRGQYESIEALRDRAKVQADVWLNEKNLSTMCRKRNGVLKACIENGAEFDSGLYTLTVPTGGGKTFSSLMFALNHAAAHHKKRVIYVIPYTSIIDQTVENFEKYLGKENVLPHYSTAGYRMSEKEDLSPQEYKSLLASENWDAPVIVTTAVQFFESLYANKSSKCRKLHNIAQSVVIFDEAQMLPIPYLKPCLAAIAQLVQHYHTTAVLCTATQPALSEVFASVGYQEPIREICLEAVALYMELRRTLIMDMGMVNAAELEKQLCGMKQVLCVVNRRKTAQELFQEMPEEGKFCLTTLSCAADRRRMLKEIRLRLKNQMLCRVISTSLIEAGVDVDFPVAFRERTGLDSVLQTAGRCNREGKRSAQESIVHVFDLEGNQVPSSLRVNVNAYRATLRKHEEIDQPKAVETYFKMLFNLKGEARLDKEHILTEIAKCKGYYPFAVIADQFHLIESQTRTIYIPLGEGAELCKRLEMGERSRVLIRRLGVYGVEVYEEQFKRLEDAHALKLMEDGSAVLTDLRQYVSAIGLNTQAESGQALFF